MHDVCFLKLIAVSGQRGLLIKAWETSEDIFLIIEEINRGNCAQIFGDIFQLIERNENGYSKYTIDVDSDIENYLEKHFQNLLDDENNKGKAARYLEYFGYSFKKIALPNNLFIHATMNTSDQSLFPMDSAFKRRWDWEYIPIVFENESLKYKIQIGDEHYFWKEVIEEINNKIKAVTESEDKKIGPYFIKLYDPDFSVTEKVFKSKVLFYIWNDILKDEPPTDLKYFFRRKDDINDEISQPFIFSDLFSGDSTQLLKDFMKYLGVTVISQ